MKKAVNVTAPKEVYIPTAEDFVFKKDTDIKVDKNFASQTFWRGVFTRFFKKPLAVIGLVIVVIIGIMAIFGPLLSEYEYDEIVKTKVEATDEEGNVILNEDGTVKMKEVTAGRMSSHIPWLHKLFTGEEYDDLFADKTFIFGTDDLGRDIATRTWYGARVSLIVAFVTILIDVIIGVSFGLVSGYFGGVVDQLMQRFVEIANSVPRLVIVSVLALFFKKGIGLVILVLILTEWIGMSKIARAEMLKTKEMEYILAARTLGAGNGRIIFKDVLPNTIGPIITQVMFSIPTAIFTEAFLSFVGVGIMLPQCSVGSLIEDGFNNITTLPYQILPPIIVLALLMLGFNFIGDGLREAMAPKLKDM